jgi:nucleotide-binding universal stress UspA family protein
MAEEKEFNRNIMIAVDESENSRRAVRYVGRLLGGVSGFKVTIFHVIAEPEEDYFPDPGEKEKWIEDYQTRLDTLMAGYREILIGYGFNPADVSIRTKRRYCPSMAECILSEQEEDRFSTIVVGRRGLSRREEFLFGSISNRVVSHARNATVWVVE